MTLARAPSPQPGILVDPPAAGRHLSLRVSPEADSRRIAAVLATIEIDENLVMGLGEPLVRALGVELPGLRSFPALTGVGLSIPSSQHALWCWLKGADAGELVHESRDLLEQLAPAFEAVEILDTFRYADNRDLSGYVDGTENPKGKKATAAALVSTRGGKLAGGSFVAVQTWLHDLRRFMGFSERDRDRIMGRRHRDNEEIATAPKSAHVKRTAQESFEPPAFILRRSMPWATSREAGLQFVAFGHSLDAYEALLRRMVGLEDGVVDGLFRFSRPLNGGYYFCPPQQRGRLRLP